MSNPAASFSLPPLVLYAERPEPRDSWQQTLESAITAWPMAMRPRLERRRIRRFICAVNDQEEELRSLNDAALGNRAEELRARLHREGTLDEPTASAFALIRENALRQLGQRHYDVQIHAGYTLLHGMVAEMDTGEGKTLAATLAAATAALSGVPVHVVTVNDYLAQRDADIMRPLYRALGLGVGTVVHGMQPEERRAAYACNITYASNKEIAFDYMRDRLALGNKVQNTALKLGRLTSSRQTEPRVVMRGLHFAIVDEADSVLVDEARTPLIISRETNPVDEQLWAEESLKLIADLEEETDYRLLREERRVELTLPGQKKLADLGEEWGGIWRSTIRREESARQALSALYLFQRDDHYLVQEDKVQIIDEYTGRIMADRSWSDGLHQLVELKEGCPVTGRKMSVARMTYQRFFRRYKQLAGLTGTASEVRWGLWSVYRLPVARIETNCPTRRIKLPDQICATVDDKWRAIVERTRGLTSQGVPVLIGTRSVGASEDLSRWLTAADIEHVVLSAAQDRDEATVIAEAGLHGHVTVATNMAGRGVDIGLGAGVVELGGLYVILSERHDARRIDRQLEGRCGRQGDPGATEAILSLEDPLLELAPGRLLSRCSGMKGKPGRWAGLLRFYLAQSRAERSNARTRRDLMKVDRRTGTLLAFSGGAE